MAVTPLVSELMISGANVFRGVIGSAVPAKTLAAGAAWPAGWEAFGLTSAPLMLTYEAAPVEADVQQAIGPVDRALTTDIWKFETKLAQVKNATIQNIASGGTGTVTTIAAGVGIPGSQELITGGNRFMAKYMYGFEGESWNDATETMLPVRGIFFRATPIPGWEIQFDKVKYAEGIALVVGALEDIARTKGQRTYQYYYITAPATA